MCAGLHHQISSCRHSGVGLNRRLLILLVYKIFFKRSHLKWCAPTTWKHKWTLREKHVISFSSLILVASIYPCSNDLNLNDTVLAAYWIKDRDFSSASRPSCKRPNLKGGVMTAQHVRMDIIAYLVVKNCSLLIEGQPRLFRSYLHVYNWKPLTWNQNLFPTRKGDPVLYSSLTIMWYRGKSSSSTHYNSMAEKVAYLWSLCSFRIVLGLCFGSSWAIKDWGKLMNQKFWSYMCEGYYFN